MVYYTYVENYKKDCEQIHGGRWNSDNICRLLHGLFCDKGPLRVQEDVQEDYMNYHEHWTYRIYMENGDYAWIKCASRKVFDKIHEDVMHLDGKKLWFNGTFMIYEVVK